MGGHLSFLKRSPISTYLLHCSWAHGGKKRSGRVFGLAWIRFLCRSLKRKLESVESGEKWWMVNSTSGLVLEEQNVPQRKSGKAFEGRQASGQAHMKACGSQRFVARGGAEGGLPGM